MNLRNRNETRLLVENWRKVLENGIENKENMLEEGWKTEFAKKLAPAIFSVGLNVSSAMNKAFATPDSLSGKTAIAVSKVLKGNQDINTLKDKRPVKYLSAGFIVMALKALKAVKSDNKLDVDQAFIDAKKQISFDLMLKMYDAAFFANGQGFDNEKFNSMFSYIQKLASEGNKAAIFLIKVDKACNRIAETIIEDQSSADDFKDRYAEIEKLARKMKNTRVTFEGTGDDFIRDASKIADWLATQ